MPNPLTEAKIKAEVRLEQDSYFDKLMRITTSADLATNVETMHQYVAGLVALKTMMRMLSDELDRGAKAMYLDAIEARLRFQKDVTT